MNDESLKHLMERSAQLRKELEFIEATIAARFPHLATPMQQQQEMQQQSQAPVNPSTSQPDRPSKEE
jgi:hypothetical protein